MVPRISDLDALASSTSGKVEIETLDDGREGQVVERLLKAAGVCPPPVLDYLDRLFHYCVASDWGRKPVAAQ